jgi:hypothetical protein
MLDRRTLALVALAGAIGGGINGLMCFVEWPVPVQEKNVSFSWYVVPGGCAHGCALAVVAFAGAAWGRRRARPWRWAGCVGVGWAAAYLSWIPIDISLGESVRKALLWPVLDSGSLVRAVWQPLFYYFGGVAALWYLWLTSRADEGRVTTSMLAASGAATAGSLWWWASWGPWYFSPLHGSVWGCLVGLSLALGRRGRPTRG